MMNVVWSEASSVWISV